METTNDFDKAKDEALRLVKETDTSGRSEKPETKKCPFCAEIIKVEAIKCKHCGSILKDQKSAEDEFLENVDKGFPGAFVRNGAYRRCLACGFKGTMKTWLRNYNGPQFIALVLLLAYIIPGLIFIAWGWGKYKCPNCGALGKNAPV